MRQATIEELLTSAATYHYLALAPETKEFPVAPASLWMKPGAILINTARGALLDETASLDGLNAGEIRRAGPEVFTLEPLKVDHPLAKHDFQGRRPHFMRQENMTLRPRRVGMTPPGGQQFA